MKTKICNRCNLSRDLSFLDDKTWKIVESYNYYKCKECRNEKRNKKRREKYQPKNKEEVLKKRDVNKLKSIQKQREYTKKWRAKNKEKRLEYEKKYIENNREKINQRFRNRYKNDISFRIKRNLRTRIWHAIKNNYKNGRTLELLDCSVEFLKQYLESKFQPGMTWENYGDWHIDHIKPCASYNLADPEQQRECFHYTNLQPLWAKDNLSKGARM